MIDLRPKLKIIWLAIHRGEKIIFDYRSKNGKVILGRTTQPTAVDNRMTVYGFDHYDTVLGIERGIENAYKLRFMDNIERLNVKKGYVKDKYDPDASLLKHGNLRRL